MCAGVVPVQSIRDEERHTLAEATTIARAMGERDGRRLVTYTDCNNTEVTSGLLAQIRNPGIWGTEVAGCVQQAARRVCTRRQRHANMRKLAEPPGSWVRQRD